MPILLRDCTNPGDMHTSNEWVLEGMCFRTRVPLCESYHLRNHSTTDKGAVKARLGRPCRTDIPDNFTSILYYPASPALVPNPHGMGFIFNELLHTGAPFLLLALQFFFWFCFQCILSVFLNSGRNKMNYTFTYIKRIFLTSFFRCEQGIDFVKYILLIVIALCLKA